MTAELERDAELEIGHVLFMDIVGFSKLLVDEQSDCSERLNQIVRRTSQFRAAEAEGKLIRLPTGDGMAPVLCAVEIAKALKDSSGFGLRMGIHFFWGRFIFMSGSLKRRCKNSKERTKSLLAPNSRQASRLARRACPGPRTTGRFADATGSAEGSAARI